MDYSKYGISESYLPTVYHNKIVIDKTTAGTVNKNLAENAYIDEKVRFIDRKGQTTAANARVGFLGNVTNATDRTIVTVNYNIVFNVPSYADFVNLTKDDDFASSYRLFTTLLIGVKSAPGDLQINSDELGVLYKKYTESLQPIAERTVVHLDKNISLQTVFNNVGKDELNLSNFDNFTRYQRKFPDGQTYFNIPYVAKFNIGIQDEQLENLFLCTSMLVKDFDIDINLNFGGFEVDNTSIVSVSAFDAYNLGESRASGYNAGPIIIDTLIDNGAVRKNGSLFTIAQNQEGVAREERFNDIKGTPWFGGVHIHNTRFMAGSQHTPSEMHPYLDENIVPNKKLIDLRPLKRLKDQKIDFTSQLKTIKNTKINYFADDSTDNILEKLTVISDPLLSTGKNGHIDGFFSISFTNFMRKNSIFSNLLGNIKQLKGLAAIASQTLKIKILRVDKSGDSKLIFDSSQSEENGIFYEKQNLTSVQGVGNKQFPLGYLNVVNMSKTIMPRSSAYFSGGALVEFYTFTDLDVKKQPEEKYRYKIELEMIDPFFNFLNLGITRIDQALRGDGNRLGLEQVLNLIKIKKGKFTDKSKTGANDFPYIAQNIQRLTNPTENFTIVDAINEYDLINGNNPPSISIQNGEAKLTFLRLLFENSDILLALGIPEDFKENSYDVIKNILDLQDFGSISIDLIQIIITTLASIRDNLKSSINAISNVDIATQKFGFSADGVSPINGSMSKRIIREETISDLTIEKQEYGFDYLEAIQSPAQLLKNLGLKQVTVSGMFSSYNRLNSRYYNMNGELPANVLNFQNEFNFSSLPLTKRGVILPEGFYASEDRDTWSNILQLLLLYIQKNASKLTNDTIFTYTQLENSKFKFDVNKNILGLDIVTEENIELLKSLDRGQKQLSTKGLSIQDQLRTDQSIFVEFDNEIETEQNDFESVVTIDNLKRNNISDYFLSYINNAVESGDQNKNKYLGGLNNLFGDDEVANQTIATLALINYSKGNIPSGSPAGKAEIGFEEYYENIIWEKESGRLFLDKYADFFFDFINSVRIEYLSGFDTYNPFPEIIDFSVARNIDKANSYDLSQYQWSPLTNDVLISLSSEFPGNTFILCKMIDFIPDSFLNVETPLIGKLKFYKKYHKYFLITGRSAKDVEIKFFGSTI